MESVDVVQPGRLDRARQAAPQIFEALREQILSLALVPGTTLSRTDLMARFGVSITPVRDALLRLAEEGLVEIFPQHATVISPIDLTQAHQEHFLRRSIELEVVRTLATAAEGSAIKRLRATLAQQGAMIGIGDYEGFTALDRSFHRQMYEAAGVPDLWALVRSRSGHIDRLRRLHLPTPGKAEAIQDDHARILAAIEDRDPDLAQKHLREHLSGTLAKVDEIRVRFPAYVRG